MSPDPPTPFDTHAELLHAMDPTASAEAGRSAPMTSGLSIDEALLLHGIGWEALDLVSGASVWRLPGTLYNWDRSGGELPGTWEGYRNALEAGIRHLGSEAARAGAHGVVGVTIDGDISAGLVEIQLIGTAVRPLHAGVDRGHERGSGMPFASDLSARDFALLTRAGYAPVGLAFGSCFVYAPRRSAADALRQSTQNIELTNLTTALYAARELAMERMQQSALALHADGIVAVSVAQGPLHGIAQTVRFSALGTAIRLSADAHQQLRPNAVVSLIDSDLQFAAESLR
jgi:uncharacterized protein YbjQ (UPF0145 family)